MTTQEIRTCINNLIAPLASTWYEFASVTGSRIIDFDYETGSRMRVKVKRGYCANKAQMFDIYVDGRDLYCIDFMNSKGKIIDRIDGAFCDELEGIFRDHTAMATRFPRFSH